ncbi:HK97 family phage prohead protease [Clostridium butyricum]|uniref:Phage prohead protease, HK97 family n=1 Tax=Clostridium butyricum E4 str. BoNT E BL5262 TaxID=632245 RepID=C4II34_CLOBU|nr:HK97 family phage prohead protease [Clostridium butyricum]EDT75849.1 phage prohead protease, HK97 family [Clostridium butyricum 5521]EEP53152.1 phage prohead protease, HK97 family [Clostridium butyricum E4 str. BoNT E BL5262]NFL33216.1 HK97 family phage prohead protease [Clostridium butyricum]NFS20422.1 HK97 family phage prohead protease [Clostridium butyricum]
MRIELRNDSVILDGYVNAVQRYSKLIPSIKGKFKEQIEPGAFQRSLEKRTNVDLLLNHDKNRKLGSIAEGNLELFEDNIGLRAICTVTDADVIEKAKNDKLKGWSFGFYSEKDNWEDTDKGYSKRTVSELDLFEVSIVDDSKNPAYIATSIETRDEKEVITENRTIEFRAVIVDESSAEETRSDTVDYSQYYNEIEKLRKKE